MTQEVENNYDEPRMQGLSIRDLRYADDTALLATTTAGLENLIKSLKEHSEQKGLFLNVKKTKVMGIDRCREEAVINIDRGEIERVISFEYLKNGKKTPEIRRRLAMATAKLKKMANVWKGQSVDTKIRVLKSTVFPTATYGCEVLNIKKTDGKLITAFKMKSNIKILRIPWTDRVTNESVLKKVKMNSTTLLPVIRKLKVGYFGHIKRHESLEKHILEAKAAGRRGRGRPMRRWEQDIQDWCEKQQQHKQEEWRKILWCFARKSKKQRPSRDQLTG